MLSRWMASLALLFLSAAAQALPVQVTQSFSDVTWDFQGFTNSVGFGQAISGDWVFKATLDSEAPRAAGNPDFGGAWAITSLTLTQASLGLVDAAITNVSYLQHWGDNIGFSYAWLVYPDTRTYLPEGSFSRPYDSNPLAAGFAPVTAAGGRISPLDEGFLFANGSRLFGNGTAVSSTIGSVVAPVPEPETWLAMIAGLGVLVGRFAKKRGESREPAIAAA